MQKRLLWLFIPLALVLFLRPGAVTQIKPRNTVQSTPTPLIHPAEKATKSVFVPYWAPKIHNEEMSRYDEYYYFGIAPTLEGKLMQDAGYQNISLVEEVPEKQKKLVLRMLDVAIADSLFKDKTAQKTLISALKDILFAHSFSGLILDLEYPFTLQPEKKGQITNFVQQICTAVKSDYKTCGILVYGDFSYRSRPYDLMTLGASVDSVLLMAYDFHKAGGEPGPNFPLSRRSDNEGGPSTIDYGYDFKTMVKDALSLIPQEKLEVVFGMYGYDWTINEQGTPLMAAQAFSASSLKLKAESLKLKVISNQAKEKNIEYVDGEGRRHIVWYEDEESAAVKTEYLQQQGIGKISFWALSYF